ncbi:MULTISPECIES: hypothetical protein [unclassified Bradyrhizobium]|uniref:hypothetical protein n=1 Tax=unclassified Bradyrhizobium TaxID=2631580 RepID=UPI0033932319
MPTPIRADGTGPTMPIDAPISEVRIRRALVTVAHIIATYGEVEYLDLMERLEQELERHREGRDPLSRARAILNAHAETVTRPSQSTVDTGDTDPATPKKNPTTGADGRADRNSLVVLGRTNQTSQWTKTRGPRDG